MDATAALNRLTDPHKQHTPVLDRIKALTNVSRGVFRKLVSFVTRNIELIVEK